MSDTLEQNENIGRAYKILRELCEPEGGAVANQIEASEFMLGALIFAADVSAMLVLSCDSSFQGGSTITTEKQLELNKVANPMYGIMKDMVLAPILAAVPVTEDRK